MAVLLEVAVVAYPLQFDVVAAGVVVRVAVDAVVAVVFVALKLVPGVVPAAVVVVVVLVVSTVVVDVAGLEQFVVQYHCLVVVIIQLHFLLSCYILHSFLPVNIKYKIW